MRGAAFRTLLDCSVPMRCHLILRSADPSIFCRASCTRFSPKSCWPASQAARTCSRENVLDTARSRTSPGCRPARCGRFREALPDVLPAAARCSDGDP